MIVCVRISAGGEVGVGRKSLVLTRCLLLVGLSACHQCLKSRPCVYRSTFWVGLPKNRCRINHEWTLCKDTQRPFFSTREILAVSIFSDSRASTGKAAAYLHIQNVSWHGVIQLGSIYFPFTAIRQRVLKKNGISFWGFLGRESSLLEADLFLLERLKRKHIKCVHSYALSFSLSSREKIKFAHIIIGGGHAQAKRKMTAVILLKRLVLSIELGRKWVAKCTRGSKLDVVCAYTVGRMDCAEVCPLLEKLSNIYKPLIHAGAQLPSLPLIYDSNTVYPTVALMIWEEKFKSRFCVMLPSQFRVLFTSKSSPRWCRRGMGLKENGWYILRNILDMLLLCTSVSTWRFFYLFIFCSGWWDLSYVTRLNKSGLPFSSTWYAWPFLGHITRNQIHSYALEYIAIEKEMAQSWCPLFFFLNWFILLSFQTFSLNLRELKKKKSFS